MSLSALLERIKHRLSADTLMRNTSWMLGSEALAKVSRIVTIVVMAKFLSPENYGLAALILLWHELFRVFTRAGAGAKVIQYQSQELSAIASAAQVQQWLFCILVIGLQWLLAPLLANYYQRPEMTALLQYSALAHGLFPLVSVRVFIVQRANRMKAFGLAQAASVSVENISIILGLMAGFDIASLVFAKILAALTWCLCFYKLSIPLPAFNFQWRIFNGLWGFSLRVFSSELIKLLRFHIDTLLAASLLSAEALGIYSFAKNAGVGLSQSISLAFINSLLPYFSEQHRQKKLAKAVFNALKLAAFVGLAFVAQALIAPIYLDLLFDSSWQQASPIVSLLCLAAIPALLIDSLALSYRAQAKTSIELLCHIATTGIAAIAIWSLQSQSAQELAENYLLASLTWLGICSFMVWPYVKCTLQKSFLRAQGRQHRS